MRLLITGAKGMLGTDARRILAEHGHEVLGTDRASSDGVEPLDINDYEEAARLFRRYRPEMVFHCAAYTNVDGCERDPDAAFKVNALGTGIIAAAAESVGASITVMSTDFVFDGEAERPYTEFDTPNPISRYGASKLAGELLAQQNCRRCYIVRTSWLYGVHGRNFPYIIIGQAQKSGAVSVVTDQIGSPTYTEDLVHAVRSLWRTPLYGCYHLSNSGETSWYEFAVEILKRTGLGTTPVHPISSDEYSQKFGSPTKRPRHSVLRPYLLELQSNNPMRPWQEALDDFLAAARAHGKIA